ncbi:MAG: cation-translocating P-type ATPase [Planctomycetes bacterium]|nr:cation-translocating P-type ATPase [Planctomycetota bacterium]
MSTCSYCRGPIIGSGYAGRGAAAYCCFGCLDRGEQLCGPECAPKRAGTGLRLGLGVLVAGQSMIFGLALNLHDDVPPAARALTQWLMLAGTALVAVLLGGPLARAAYSELRRGRLTIEALFLLTATGALAASLQAHHTGRGKLYYEVVSVLLVVYTVGKLVGARARDTALARARAWGDGLCLCRVVDAAGRTRTAPVAEVNPGDVVEVYAGETIAVDGVIRAGVGFVAEAAVTGEPFAVVRRPGDRVLAGSASCDATFRVTATARGTERQVDRLLAAVAAARAAPLSLQARADRLGRWFLPLVAGVALATFAYWTRADGWETGLLHAMSVLLVACPCAIGLATPVVIWSALARLAERGVIVRGGDAIEKLATAERAYFDKTGTLTEDRFALVDVEVVAPALDRATLLGWLSLVQAQSAHPVARPFAELPRPFAPGAEPRVRSVVAVPGCGVAAELEETTGARHEINIGTSDWLCPVSCEPRASANASAKLILVTLNGALVARATLTERVRASAPDALAHFARLGMPVEVLSGDAPARAAALGVPARGHLTPDDKRAAVEGTRALFVGDGINDAGALAAAHVGVALSSGTDLAVGAAPVTLYTPDLRALPWAVEQSRAAVRAVRRNLARAVAYNLVGVALAACGALHPVVAALLMVVSSASVLFSATRAHEAKKPTPLPEGRGEIEPSRAGDVSLAPMSAPPLPEGRGVGGVGFFGIGGLGSSLAHFLAFALQGVLLVLLVPALPAVVPLAFALVGAALAYAWHRGPVPHWPDMAFGMLTLGNFGMLLGWYADSGFAPPACGHCACATSMQPWMWVGMLLGANVAMRWIGRAPVTTRCHSVAMYTGGNAGMVLGMLAGGAWAARLAPPDARAAVAVSFAAMTAGMLAGMFAGTWLAERALSSEGTA